MSSISAKLRFHVYQSNPKPDAATLENVQAKLEEQTGYTLEVG